MLTVPTDVGIERDCERLIAATVERFGGVDVLVNNAGVSGHAMFADVADFGWYQDMMRVNLFGAVWCTRHALAHLVASRGQVVGVASLAGKFGVPGRTAYSASKFALAGFFEALRIELPPDVAILLIEHDMGLVFRFAKLITVLVGGAELVTGDPQAIAADPRVREVYLGQEHA